MKVCINKRISNYVAWKWTIELQWCLMELRWMECRRSRLHWGEIWTFSIFFPLICLCNTLTSVHAWSLIPHLVVFIAPLFPPPRPSWLHRLSFTLFLTLFFPLVHAFSLLSFLAPPSFPPVALTPLTCFISPCSWKWAFPPGWEPHCGCFGSGHPHR